ncbi:MAG: MFS transporter, partial [Actinomycetota bacterium]
FGIFTQVDSASSFAVIVTGSVIFSLGTAPLFTLTNDLIIGSAPPERAGAAAGISETAAELGGALGIAIFGSIGTAVYRSQVIDGVPDGVAPETAEAARDTLGGAIDVAAQLPGDLGPVLIDAAREAFTYGLHLGAAISAVGSIGLAVLVVTLLRHVRTGSELDGQTDLELDGAVDVVREPVPAEC